MKKWLENFKLWSSWKIRRFFRMKNQMIAPIQWNSPLLELVPDMTLNGKLPIHQTSRFHSIIREVRTISMLTKHFPSKITDEDWMVLLECPTRKQRLDHIKFLRSKELERQKDQEKKLAKMHSSVKVKEEVSVDSFPLYYPATKLAKDQRRLMWQNVANAYRCSAPTIIIDCRFLPFLSPRGAELTAMQLSYLISENRDSRTPWQLFFTNLDISKEKIRRLKRRHLSVMDSSMACSPVVIPDNYTTIFPRERVVYLSPDAEDELIDVNDEEIYVLGGIVDRVVERGISRHASLETALADGVSCKKLPIDKYVKWKSGTKFLTLPAVFGILRDVHSSGGNWKYALRHIPVRNLRSADEKSAVGREFHNKIRNFDCQLLRILERELGEEVQQASSSL